jgi:hypothetical protein
MRLKLKGQRKKFAERKESKRKAQKITMKEQ